MASCPSCAASNPDAARFCMACGVALLAPAGATVRSDGRAAAPAGNGASLPTESTGPGVAVRETRRTVTILFSDLADSTGLGERLEPETVRRVLDRYFGAMRVVIERHGGTVEKFVGDAIMAVFGLPVAHEDDALRAVRAAADMRAALEGLNAELERLWRLRLSVRIGVNTGEVVTGNPSAGSTFVTGDAVNVGARLEQVARAGDILLGATTVRLVRGAVTTEALPPLTVKGKAEPILAHRLLAVAQRAQPIAGRLNSPLVGRKREIKLLREAFERSRSGPSCQLMTVLGAAGVGKSRLVREFLQSVREEATILRGRCLPYGDGITYWPVTQTIRAAARVADTAGAAAARDRLTGMLTGQDRAAAIADGLLGALGMAGESPARAEEIAWATRRLYETLAARRPLIVVFDDLHWAESSLLDLIEHVADWSRRAPILLCCMARPELLEARPNWSGGKRNAATTLLEPLSAEDSGRLAANLLGGWQMPDIAARRIVEAGEGNPLFVEELVAMLVDDGRLRPTSDGWVPVGDLADLVVPPTIAALIAARLDRLARRERSAIERASVVGKQFSRGAVAELTPDDERPAVPASLLNLVRKELIRPDLQPGSSDEAYRFRHLLIRDAAYGGMPKDERADLHERFAGWLERTAGARPEFEEIIAYHLEQAARCRAELMPNSDAAAAIARRASDLLWVVALKARDRGDAQAAAHLLARSTDLTAPDRRARPLRLVEMSAAQFAIGELDAAAASAAAALAAAVTRGDVPGMWHARLAAIAVRDKVDPSIRAEETLTAADEARAAFASAGDELGLSRAWRLRGDVSRNRCQWAAAEAAWLQALDHALAAEAGREVDDLRTWIPSALYFGPTPVREAVGRILEIRATAGRAHPVAGGDPRIAGLLARIGRFDEARVMYRSARVERQERGLVLLLAGVSLFSSDVELLAGDEEAAERELRVGIGQYRALGERSGTSTLLGRYADLCARQGRDAEAIALVAECRETSAADDIASQCLWRGVEARLHARQGRHAEAEASARDAIALLSGSDQLDMIGWSQEMAAEALAGASRPSDALRHASAAVAAYERKGNLAAARRARSRWSSLEG
jgi:class 3 adenylate cyclase/tetratricopeptide (TPR) repeat protein